MLSWNWCRTCWTYSEAGPTTRPPERSGMHRIFLVCLLSGCLAAQQQAPAQPSSQPPAQPSAQPATQLPTIRTTVDVVVAPVLVFDRDGQYVSGLEPEQFHLFDNNKEQNIHVDVSYIPISLVIAIQANQHVEALMPQIQRIGNMIEPMILGDQGEAAVIAYDSRVREL